MPQQPLVMLVIADSSRTGGPEHVLTLAREHLEAGWHPLVVSPAGELQERCRESGVGSLAVEMGGARWAAAARRVRQLARRRKVDLVHTHGLRAAGVVRRAGIRVPWVHTHHLDGWFTASRWRIAVHRYELRRLQGRCSLQIAVSASVRDFLTAEVGVREYRLRLIPNGIAPLRARLRPLPGGARIGILASLTQAKGVDLALMALATPAGRKLTLSIGGAGPDLRKLVDLAAALGVADRADFLGEVVDRQAFFDSCDAVWVPSRAEPFGLVACEAMSAGVPVVASRVGGLPEILDPPRAGVCVSPANPAALASVTAALLGDHERYQRLSEAGAARVRQHFTATRMAALTRGVYRESLP